MRLSVLRTLHFSTSVQSTERSCKLLVLGGGAGGCSIASKFVRKLGNNEVIVVEPSDKHYYQPMFTLVGGGMKTLNDSVKPMKEVLPKGATWIQDSVKEIKANENYVITDLGVKITYQYLLVAIGITLNFEKIPGVYEGLNTPNSGVCSNYSEKYVDRTFEALQNFQSGNLLFTFPSTPVKCAGAPQKICYIAEDYLRKHSKREKATVIYFTPLNVLFGVKKYADELWKVCEKRDIKVNLKHNLIEIMPDKKVAVFENLENPQQPPVKVPYSFIHVTPPMSPSKVLQSCKGLADGSGFLDVDKLTLRHKVFDNVFGIGDCTNAPTSRTAAAVAAQNGVVGTNLLHQIQGKPLMAEYDGYTSCPLVTGYSKCILAEFNYDLLPQETFPIDQSKERQSMFHFKKTILPAVYWNGLLRGYWDGPSQLKKILRMGRKS